MSYAPWSTDFAAAPIRRDEYYDHVGILGRRYDALRAMDLERRHPTLGHYTAALSPETFAEWMFFALARDHGYVPDSRDGFIAARLTRDLYPDHPHVLAIWRAMGELPALPGAAGVLPFSAVMELASATAEMDADAAAEAWAAARGFEWSARAGGWVPIGTTASAEEQMLIRQAAARCGIPAAELSAAVAGMRYEDAAAVLSMPHCGAMRVQLAQAAAGAPFLSGPELERAVLGVGAGGVIDDPRYAGRTIIVRDGDVIDAETGDVIGSATGVEEIAVTRPALAGITGPWAVLAVLGAAGAVLAMRRRR